MLACNLCFELYFYPITIPKSIHFVYFSVKLKMLGLVYLAVGINPQAIQKKENSRRREYWCTQNEK